MDTGEARNAAVHLRYTTVPVLAAPAMSAPVMATLATGDAFEVTCQTGGFYAVTLPDGRSGFVFARNLAGPGLPAKPAAMPAAPASEPRTGLRKWLASWLRLVTGRGV